ncbi:G-protein coupled receptor 157-like isoform X2 [Mizuhopecten yessoensis]|uniref:G-protein coupled receptor 157-like isoform X2 n=1 Tax=Mizuhopecten yessoensis TaxID=6573 RepID=UPI000B45751C|nr:G-protein coupled receptor 157-like isoform X2 [Mizuhopecten yessoensis]
MRQIALYLSGAVSMRITTTKQQQYQYRTINNNEKTTVAAATTITLIIVGVGWSRNALGESASLDGSWCWISDSISDREEWIWMVVTKQGWEMVVYLGTCFMFIIIGYQRFCRNTRRLLPSHYNVTTDEMSTAINVPGERTQLMTRSTSSQNRGYPTLSVNSVLVWVGMYFYFAKMWGTIRYGVHIYELAFDGDVSGFGPAEKYFFIFAQSLGDSLQATITCCVFVLKDAELRRKVCCRRAIRIEQSTHNHQT